MSGIIAYQSDSGRSGIIGSPANFSMILTSTHALVHDNYTLIKFDTVKWDVGNNFNNTNTAVNGMTYAFVAPVTGTYSFTWLLGIEGVNTGNTRLLPRFDHKDSGGTELRVVYFDVNGPDHILASNMGGVWGLPGSTSAKMRGGDTASLRCSHSGGSAPSAGNTHTTFNGWYTGPEGR